MRGLLKRSGKRTVCGMVSSRNQKPPSWEKARVATALYHAEAFVCLLKSAPSRIMRVKRRWNTSGLEGSPDSFFGVEPTSERTPDGMRVYRWNPPKIAALRQKINAE